MSTYRQTGRGALFAEHQGPFAPEVLPDTVEPVVFSREFTNGEQIVTVSAAPTIPARFQEWMTAYEGPIPEDGYDVETCAEVRDAGDEGGGTSEYEWDFINHNGLTLSQAIKTAREYVASIQPERDFA